MKTKSTLTEAKEIRQLVSSGFELARQLHINKILVVSELISDRRLVEKHRDSEEIIWVTNRPESVDGKRSDQCVVIPRSPAGRMDLVSLSLIIAVMNGFISECESIVCLVGVAGSKRLDNLLIVNPERDFEWFGAHGFSRDGDLPISQEFVRIIDIALKFSVEGREGKPIGTVFLLGELEQLNKIARPLILNPCKGHPKKARNIHDSEFVETMREYAALDGAFLVNQKGIVESAGVYIDAPVTKSVEVPKGLGSRHLAAAAATAHTAALAIAVSESSGTVTVFSKGAKVLSLSRPTSGA